MSDSEDQRGSLARSARASIPEADALAWILGEPDSAHFVGEIRGRSWLHARSEDRERFGSLLALGELDEILGTYGLRHPAVRLVRSDEEIPPAEYLWRDGMVDPAQAARLFADGATVIFGSLHDRHEGMRRLCSAVGRQLSVRTQTNIYLTPPGSQGFKPHWDTHDVLVLQVEGSKRWRIYAGGPELPLRDQAFDPELHAPGPIEAELTLEAGEALYIPRGLMHAAVTTDRTSIHVTLGLMTYTWSDLLIDCLSELVERVPAWRESLPAGFAHADADALGAVQRGLRERLERFIDEVELATVVAERQAAFEAHQRPRTTDALRQALGAASIEREHLVRWRGDVPGRIERRNGRVVVTSRGREIDFPASAHPTLDHIRDGRVVTAGEVEDGLDWESRRVVLSALVREGLVSNESRGGRP